MEIYAHTHTVRVLSNTGTHCIVISLFGNARIAGVFKTVHYAGGYKYSVRDNGREIMARLSLPLFARK